MIGNKGYKGESFKDSLSYKISPITIADIVKECMENRNSKIMNKLQKRSEDIGKEPGE